MEHGISTFAQGQGLIGTGLTGQGLIAAWVLVAAALVALGIVGYVAIRSRTRPVHLEKAGLETALQTFRALDIDAFRNLVDADEEAFLRAHLPPRKFRKVKRQRAWAALIYAWEAGRAATALATVAQAAQRSSDSRIAASAAQVAENAFRLRLQTLQASLHLAIEIALPGIPSRSMPPFADQYERTAQTLIRLGRFSSGARELARSKSA